jgi:ribonuclease P protein component
MIPKKNRIEKSLFDSIYKSGTPIHTPLFYLLYSHNSSLETKFSFVVSKKIAKTAVLRNKLRRRGYSVIRKNMSQIESHVQCLIFLKAGSGDLLFKEYENQLVFLLKKAKIM